MILLHILRLGLIKFIFLFALTVPAQGTGSRKVIVIDPGHGGKDPGAIGINYIKEKDVVLDLGLKILQLNEQEAKYEIYLTRYTDTLVSLRDRTTLAKALKADLFVSLHCNHSSSPSAKGMEIFVAPGELSESKRKAILIAFGIQKSITTATGIYGRGIKFSNFQVLKETSPISPSILIELLFLSNTEEAEYSRNPWNLDLLASIILKNL